MESDAKPAGKKISKELDSGMSLGGAGTGFVDAFSSKLAALKPIAIGAAVAMGIVKSAKEAIDASMRQEDAIARMENSLRRIGEYSHENSKEMQSFASSIQSVTRYGDEALLEQLALAQGMGATAEQSKEIIKASTDLASALNLDLSSAVRNITKTLSGQKGELGELIPALRSLTAEQLKSGEAIKVIGGLYQGFAERDIDTMSGAITRAKNSFGDLMEGFGSFITRSETVKGIIRGMTTVFDYWAEKLNSATEVKPISIEDLDTQISMTTKQIDALKKQLASLPAVSDFQARIMKNNRLETQAEKIEKKLRDLTLLDIELNTERNKILAEQEGQERIRAEKEAEEIIRVNKAKNDSILAEMAKLGMSQVLTAQEYYDQRVAALSRARERELVTEDQYNRLMLQIDRDYQNQRLAEMPKETIEPLEGEGFFSGMMASQKQFEEHTKQSTKNMARAWTSFGQTAKRSIGDGLGQGFAAMGRAIVEGGNVFDEFTKAFLASLAQMAIQQGSMFILQGLGFQMIPGLQANGTALIAAGVGLTLLGGVLQALSGGSGPTSTSEAPNYGSSSMSDSELVTGEEMEREEEKAQININIDRWFGGSDRQQFARDIVDLVSEEARSSGIKVFA